jgi:ABC-2 type transport system permease protein
MNSIAIAINLIRRTFGNKKGILTFLLAPSLIVALVISFLGSGSSQPTVAYVNGDREGLGGYVISALADSGEYKLAAAPSAEAARQSVSENKAAAAILIPDRFGERLLQGGGAEVEMLQMRVDEETFGLKLAVEQTIRSMNQAVSNAKEAGSAGPQLLGTVERIWIQQQTKQVGVTKTDLGLEVNPAVDMATGILLVFMLSLVTSSVASIVEDKRNRTMTRMYTAPVRAWEIAAGNFIGSFAIGTIQTVIVLVFSRYALGFDYGVGFWLHFLVIEFFLLAAMGLGCTIAGLVRNPNHLGAINSLIITPTCMLGGCFWPVELTPEFMQKLSNIVPQRWAIDALRQLAAGESLAGVSLQLGILVLFAVILLGFGSVVLRPNES